MLTFDSSALPFSDPTLCHLMAHLRTQDDPLGLLAWRDRFDELTGLRPSPDLLAQEAVQTAAPGTARVLCQVWEACTVPGFPVLAWVMGASVDALDMVARQLTGTDPFPTRQAPGELILWTSCQRVFWCQRHHRALAKTERILRQERETRDRAEAGDVDALLRLPGARQCATRGKGLSAWTPRRKAQAEAKRRMADRSARRADRQAGEQSRVQPAGRIRALWLDRLCRRAVLMGEQFHRSVRSLYTSSRASVVYGRGGQAGRDNEAYSRAYRARYGGARWQNAGARLDSETSPTCVILETSRGTEVARLPLDWTP